MSKKSYSRIISKPLNKNKYFYLYSIKIYLIYTDIIFYEIIKLYVTLPKSK